MVPSAPSVPEIYPLETLHNAMTLSQLENFFARLTTIKFPSPFTLPRVPPTPVNSMVLESASGGSLFQYAGASDLTLASTIGGKVPLFNNDTASSNKSAGGSTVHGNLKIVTPQLTRRPQPDDALEEMMFPDTEEYSLYHGQGSAIEVEAIGGSMAVMHGVSTRRTADIQPIHPAFISYAASIFKRAPRSVSSER